MYPELTFVDLLAAIGAAQGVFLALLLINQRQRALPNRLLAAFILAFVLLTVGDIFYYSHLLLCWPHAWLVCDPLAFVLAPLFYLYVSSLVQRGFLLKKAHVVHLLPTFLLYCALLWLYIQPASVKIHFLQEEYAVNRAGTDVVLVLAAVQMLGYFAAAFMLLRKHAMAVRENYSFREWVDLRWLRIMIGVMVVLWLAFLVASLFGWPLLKMFDRMMFPIAVYGIGYMGIRQSVVFQPDMVSSDGQPAHVLPAFAEISSTTERELNIQEATSPLEGAETEQRKYLHSTLMPETAAVYAERLVEIMEHEKLYINNELKLHDVAAQLGIRSHHISQVLNEYLGKSFFDFVNGYRINEVKRRLRDPAFSHFTLLSIGLESGFNSKAAFNAAFKKHTGLTPSQYRRSIEPEKPD